MLQAGPRSRRSSITWMVALAAGTLAVAVGPVAPAEAQALPERAGAATDLLQNADNGSAAAPGSFVHSSDVVFSGSIVGSISIPNEVTSCPSPNGTQFVSAGETSSSLTTSAPGSVLSELVLVDLPKVGPQRISFDEVVVRLQTSQGYFYWVASTGVANTSEKGSANVSGTIMVTLVPPTQEQGKALKYPPGIGTVRLDGSWECGKRPAALPTAFLAMIDDGLGDADRDCGPQETDANSLLDPCSADITNLETDVGKDYQFVDLRSPVYRDLEQLLSDLSIFYDGSDINPLWNDYDRLRDDDLKIIQQGS